MSNIYKKPNSDVRLNQDWELGVSGVIFTILSGLVASTIYIVLGNLVQQFDETFSTFGAELPIFTRLSISMISVFPFFACPVLLNVLFTLVPMANSKLRRRIYRTCLLQAVIAIFVLILVMITMYLPIFQLSSVV